MTRPSKPPVVTILSYNKVDLLRPCLESVFENTEHPHRVCVVDQASTDGTKNYLRQLGDRIDVISTDKNLGFVLGNNLVMDRYPDRDIVLLNNDTEVTHGWLRALADRAHSQAEIGVVGAKLVFPDGKLQAAGCEIFSDASGREIGKNDDRDRFVYNQTRDVDYCSGACVFLKRAMLEKAGTFDPQFAPAYWEDTDLCFAARRAGFRVVYEPRAVVVHHEGGSFGAPAQRSRSAELQARNKPKFIAKWKDELARQRSNVFEVPRREGKDRILVILPFLPLFDRAAGEMRWFHTLRILAKRYQVVLLARNGQDGLKYINPLEEQGITVFHTDTERLRQLGCEMVGPLWIDFPALLRSNDFKAVIVGFYHVASQYYRDVRAYSPRSLLIIDSFDVAFLRERRRAEVSSSDRDLWHAEEVKRIELSWYRKADMVLTVTEQDREVLLAEDPTLRVGISTDIHPLPPFEWNPDRKDLVFIGNFKHQPNEDAVLYFSQEVLPLIHEKLPEVKFYVVGNAPTPAVKRLASERVVVTGYVPDILPYLQRCRVCVVPLRYGAGLKGKVGQAMAAGIPQVATSVGAEGMGLVHERDILVADTPEEFAREVTRLYQDPALQRRLAENARALVARQYSYGRAEAYWEEVFSAIDAGREEEKKPPPRAREASGYRRLPKRPEIVPRVSIVMPVLNNLALTQTAWAGIRKNTRIPFELLVIDNGSEEPVAYDAEQNNYRCIRNERNLGFAEAVNQGIQNTYGDYVVILNNDCIVTPGWLERLVAHLEEDDKIGVVAPLTNYASTEQRIPAGYRDEKSLYKFSERIYEAHRGQRRELTKVVGMCMVIPRRVVEEVGLFDRRFGIGNFEDDDFCLRMRLAGYKVICAQDVFIHHEGGATFRSMKVDYEGLLKRNSDIFLRKWAPIGAARSVERTSAPPEMTVLCFQDGPGAAEIHRALEHVPPGMNVRVLCEDPEAFRGAQGSASSVKRGKVEAFYRRIDEEIRAAESTFVLVLSSRVRGARGWIQDLLESTRGKDRAGILVPRSNEGGRVQRVRPGYRSPEDGLERYAARNRERNRRVSKPIRDPAGSCLLVRRQAYVDSGGLSPEFRTAAAWVDLVERMADRDWTSECALGSYVHVDPGEERFSATDPEEENAVLQLREASRLFAESDLAGAMKRIDESLAHKPDYTRALYCRALFLAGEGRLQEAESDLKGILSVDPSFSPAKNNLGCLAFEQGRDEEAERHFREALTLEPGNRELARNLGDFYLSTGAVGKGLSVYEGLVKQNPNDPETYLDLGRWFCTLGDPGGAVEWYRQALRVAPDCKEAQDRLSVLERTGREQPEAAPRVN